MSKVQHRVSKYSICTNVVLITATLVVHSHLHLYWFIPFIWIFQFDQSDNQEKRRKKESKRERERMRESYYSFDPPSVRPYSPCKWSIYLGYRSHFESPEKSPTVSMRAKIPTSVNVFKFLFSVISYLYSVKFPTQIRCTPRFTSKC